VAIFLLDKNNASMCQLTTTATTCANSQIRNDRQDQLAAQALPAPQQQQQQQQQKTVLRQVIKI